jgi:hypothetical protein
MCAGHISLLLHPSSQPFNPCCTVLWLITHPASRTTSSIASIFWLLAATGEDGSVKTLHRQPVTSSTNLPCYKSTSCKHGTIIATSKASSPEHGRVRGMKIQKTGVYSACYSVHTVLKEAAIDVLSGLTAKHRQEVH